MNIIRCEVAIYLLAFGFQNSMITRINSLDDQRFDSTSHSFLFTALSTAV